MAGPTPAQQHEPIRLKWAEWLDRVKDDVLAASAERVIWNEVREAIEVRSSGTPDTFLRHYNRLYAHAQSMAVRRLMLYRSTDERSLSSLIKNFIVHPDVVTRERYARDQADGPGPDWPAEARKIFDKRFGGGGENLSVQKLQDDLARIADVCTKVTAYADNVVAHVGRSVSPPTYVELDAAIDITEEMFVRYSLLLTGSSWILPPVIQDPWHRTLDRPLFPPRRTPTE